MTDFPQLIQNIESMVKSSQQTDSNLESMQTIWDNYIERLSRLIPEVSISGGGESVVLGELSPGCQACKNGTWDCIFLSNRCNLHCPFCYSPHSIPEDFCGSAFGSSIEEIVLNYNQTNITGISFSGGEPFLEPAKLVDWVSAFTSCMPNKYYWIYTNGLLVNEEILRKLSSHGVKEIRFNTAATEYDHPAILSAIQLCSRHIPNVTVEIPVIPEHASKLLNSLSLWSKKGVKYLNLHELIFEPGTNAFTMPGPRQSFTTEDGHITAFHPGSRELSLKIMRKAKDEGLNLSVNDCSMQSKLCQVRGRRKSLATLTQEPYEKYIKNGFFETLAAYRNRDAFFFHPDSLTEIRMKFPQWQFVRLVRRAPLSRSAPKEWVLLEEMRF